MIARSTCLEGVACIRVGKIHWALALPLLVSCKGCSCFVDSKYGYYQRSVTILYGVVLKHQQMMNPTNAHLDPHLPTNIVPSCLCSACVRVLVPSLVCC